MLFRLFGIAVNTELCGDHTEEVRKPLPISGSGFSIWH